MHKALCPCKWKPQSQAQPIQRLVPAKSRLALRTCVTKNPQELASPKIYNESTGSSTHLDFSPKPDGTWYQLSPGQCGKSMARHNKYPIYEMIGRLALASKTCGCRTPAGAKSLSATPCSPPPLQPSLTLPQPNKLSPIVL